MLKDFLESHDVKVLEKKQQRVIFGKKDLCLDTQDTEIECYDDK
ncbi:hypothetical protein U6A24_13990 [Aquimarina gracilis]|uniref:Uncharacterized protein n=1 Tax=Aquimarina gracilis TaxID=874422 RepID=A0ABU5ZXF6_9FLAO|nr:hypothetical protein [Aquimarina gracilis]MEB3346585.1 hypothetical protein [Aquimarina gracilis]